MAIESIGNSNAVSAVELYTRQNTQTSTQQQQAVQQTNQQTQDEVEISHQARQLSSVETNPAASTAPALTNAQVEPAQQIDRTSSKAIAAYQQSAQF